MELEKLRISENTGVVVNNEWLVLNPKEFIDGLTNRNSINVVQIPLSEINYSNSYDQIIGLTNVAEFNSEMGIDFEFIKNIDPEKKVLFLVDGIPSHNYDFVAEYLISRKIKELDKIGINESIAIWGKSEGKNGAVRIKTFEKNEVIVPIIIK